MEANTTPVSLPIWLSQYVVSEKRRATHKCEYKNQEWYLRVPTKQQLDFKRNVDTCQHFSPGAVLTPMRNTEKTLAVQAWAGAHLERTELSSDRISAVELSDLFHKDCTLVISARALGNAMSWLGFKRIKTRGVNKYTMLRYKSSI
jgi:hypothetical protein